MKSCAVQTSRPDAASIATTPRPFPPAIVITVVPNATGLVEYPQGFTDSLDGAMSGLRSASTGRPGYPPLVMLKALLLAQWYGLSDPELEDALADRLSFRRFVGLPLDAAVPDETTLCRFRGELARRGLTERLVAALDAQLAARGLVLRRGTLIDATLVEADADVRKGPDGRPVTVEREAGFAKRRGKRSSGSRHISQSTRARVSSGAPG